MNRKNTITYLAIFVVIATLIVAGLWLGKGSELVELEEESIAQETEGGVAGLSVGESTNQVDLYFFWSKTCPFCITQKDFLESIQGDYPQLNVHAYEVSESEENYLLWLAISQAYGIENPQGVPMTFISDRHFVGFAVDPIGHEIIRIIEGCLESVCVDPASLVEA
jgi:glutaredoxin